jgi:hypothetical protein
MIPSHVCQDTHSFHRWLIAVVLIEKTEVVLRIERVRAVVAQIVPDRKREPRAHAVRHARAASTA